MMEQWIYMETKSGPFWFLQPVYYLVAIKLRLLFTNNMAEYEACISGFEATPHMNIKDLEVYEESILILSQSTGQWVVKSQN